MKLKVKDPEKLKEDIIMSGYTITSLAKNVGITKNYLSAIVHQRRSPGADVANLITTLINERLGTNYLVKDIFFTFSVEKLPQ